jgi:hypothetical protein
VIELDIAARSGDAVAVFVLLLVVVVLVIEGIATRVVAQRRRVVQRDQSVGPAMAAKQQSPGIVPSRRNAVSALPYRRLLKERPPARR